MKFSYKVPINTRVSYTTSTATRNAVSEITRKVIAEDFEWDDGFTPAPLTYFAALSLSRVFHRINPLKRILQKDVDILMDLYPADIPLKYSVPLINDEQYWKRSYATKFPTRLELGVAYWKGKFLSACLQDYLENVKPDIFIEEEAIELAYLVSPFIFELKLNQMMIVHQPKPPVPYEDVVEDTCVFSVPKVYDHIPLEPVLRRLYNLQEITLIFGLSDLQEKYDTRYFEFSMGDCESLCRGLEDLKHLRIFRINRSNLDCSKLKYILQNLIKLECIEELDFNHCKIGDYGMKALGGFIFLHNNLKVVRIANNRFGELGVQGIAYSLQMKPAAPIELIDFSLNTLSLECATMFAAAFVRCKEKPQTLIVSSCGLQGASAEKIAGLLSLNRGLRRLDMAANDLSGEAEKTLIAAMHNNKKILKVDLRRTHVSDETLEKVNELLERNKRLIGQETEPSDEIPPLYLNEPEYLLWEYNPNNPDYIPGRYPARVPEV